MIPTIAVTPHRPAHVLTLDYRVDRGRIQVVPALFHSAEVGGQRQHRLGHAGGRILHPCGDRFL